MPSEPTTWPDWINNLSSDDGVAAEQSMRNLARYANPEMLAMLGIGTGEVRLSGGDRPAEVAASLARQLQGRAGGYTVEPFSAAGHRLQIIRTASELLEGAGTCVDFALAVAAGCVRESVPVFLCVLVPAGESELHAFLALPPSEKPADEHVCWHVYDCLDIGEFTGKMVGARGLEIIDPTPDSTRADELLRKGCPGVVHLVWVQETVTPERSFYKPPERPRSLGITTLLPDLPTLREFPSRADMVTQLQQASGTVVLLGETGVGKSTLALMRAHREASGRGWFLDGSDRDALQASFAAGETQCQGRSLDNIQKENVSSLSAAARHRLAAANRPWVVVIDNADGKIEPVADLVPRPGPSQLVVITSTNPEWQEYASAAGWTLIQVGRLDKASDLAGVERALALPERLLLPGMLRLGLAAAAQAPDTLDGDLDVPQLLRALFGEPAGLVAALPTDTVAACLLAAAMMPPEDVRQEWLASSTEIPGEVPRAIEHLVSRGVLETSRRIRDARTPDRRTFWLHRLIRDAVVTTYVDIAQPAVLSIICRVLQPEPDLTPHVVRSQKDLFMLADLLEEAVTHPTDPALPGAIGPILDALEPRGGKDVARAAELARASLPIFPVQTDADWRLRATPMLAVARGVFRDGKSDEDGLAGALTICDELAGRLAADQSVEGRLVRGRTEAMRALLLRKRASRLQREGDYDRAIPLLKEIIEVLIRSFVERSCALNWNPPPLHQAHPPADGQPTPATYQPFEGHDPDHHIDRAWFNVGGAYIDLAKAVLRRPPSGERRCELVRQWSEALWGYAGSLWVRREETMYRAASLWGVALVLYMAALNNAVPLDLSSVPPSEAIEDLWGRQDREVLLTVAERCAAQAHAIRVRIAGPLDGDTRKTRDLLLKISMAWRVTQPTVGWADAAARYVAAFIREDLGLPPPADTVNPA